jgi:cell division protein FtsW (lipid II flippase)
MKMKHGFWMIIGCGLPLLLLLLLPVLGAGEPATTILLLLLMLLCPLMMFFGHGKHGGDGHPGTTKG